MEWQADQPPFPSSPPILGGVAEGRGGKIKIGMVRLQTTPEPSSPPILGGAGVVLRRGAKGWKEFITTNRLTIYHDCFYRVVVGLLSAKIE